MGSSSGMIRRRLDCRDAKCRGPREMHTGPELIRGAKEQRHKAWLLVEAQSLETDESVQRETEESGMRWSDPQRGTRLYIGQASGSREQLTNRTIEAKVEHAVYEVRKGRTFTLEFFKFRKIFKNLFRIYCKFSIILSKFSQKFENIFSIAPLCPPTAESLATALYEGKNDEKVYE